MNKLKQHKWYYATMVLWILIVIGYFVGKHFKSDNIEFLPYVNTVAYIAIVLVVFEPLVHYMMDSSKDGLTCMVLIGSFIFTVLAIAMIGIFIIITYKESKYSDDLIYVRDNSGVHHDMIYVYEPFDVLFMKKIDYYSINKNESFRFYK